MITCYRTTDGALIDLSDQQLAALPPIKRDMLKLFETDPEPQPAADQVVRQGPIVVGAKARKTWTVEPKTSEVIAMEQFAAKRESDLQQIKAAYQALSKGTGTAAERLTRCEKVLARLLMDEFRGEPT